jgi:Ca-activated chloride channel family protein
LGVGTVDGAPIAVPEGGFLKDEQGNIVVAKLNENELIKLAQAGNGIYHAITADDADIQSLLSTTDKPTRLQGKENQNVLLDLWSDKGPWLLLPVLPLAALMFRKGLFCFALLLILPLPKNSYAFEWQDLWKTKDQQAQQAYNHKQFEQAAQLYKNADWKAAAQYKAGNYEKALETLKDSKSANTSYNQGNALAQSGHLEEAVKAYEKALAAHPGDEDTLYNKDLVEKELKKQQQQKQQQDKQDQQKDDKQQSSKENSQQNQDKQDEKEKSEQSDEQKNAENKSEQKPSDSEKSSEQQQEQNSKADEKKPEEANKAEQAKQQEQNKENKPSPQKSDAVTAKEQPMDETKQANEQWLKRIPDDPAGLLKRKFRYQYGQRQHPSGSETGGW